MAKGMDVNKMLQQVQQMQAEMAKAQEELAVQTVEASVGGGMVTVTANGAGEILQVKIKPEAIDPEDPETLEDLVLAGVNEALRNAQELMQSRLGGALGGARRARASRPLGETPPPRDRAPARGRRSSASLVTTWIFFRLAQTDRGAAVIGGVMLEAC